MTYKGREVSSETYSLRTRAEANVFLDLEFFNTYKHKINTRALLFDVIPYEQIVWFSSPYDGEQFIYGLIGQR